MSGKPYGSEYTTLLAVGNIKFVRYNDSAAAKTPMETMTKGRTYVTVTADNELKAITRYDRANKRYKQIDLAGKEHTVNGKKVLPHTHYGYFHAEHGTQEVSEKEKQLIDKVTKMWNNRKTK